MKIKYLPLGIASRSDFAANVLLFIPLTFLAMSAVAGDARRGRRWACGLMVAVGALGLSAGIEFTQLYFPHRTVSVNDIVGEFGGGLIGILFWLMVGPKLSRWMVGVWWEGAGGGVVVKVWCIYTVGLVLYQLMPFDLTLSPVDYDRPDKSKLGNDAVFTVSRNVRTGENLNR